MGGCTVASLSVLSDGELVEAVREGDDTAFEELYRRYSHRIGAFVRGLARDEARAEDITQDAFFSALRRLRATESEIAFKPWIYEIARNAAIDSYRRTSRAEEVSMDTDEMRPSDHGRLVGSRAPDSALLVNERMRNLRGALDELSETHHRILVMRELEGLSYREIGERLELTRPAVESTLFRARRRLEREYEELDTGRRCDAIRTTIAELAEGVESEAGRVRVARHARRCSSCRRMARELGMEPMSRRARIAARAAAVLPLPVFLRRPRQEVGSDLGPGGQAAIGTALGPGMQIATALGERVAALVTAAALAGAGGVMVSAGPQGDDATPAPRSAGERPAVTKTRPSASREMRLQREAGAASRRQRSESVRDLASRRANSRAFKNSEQPPAPSRAVAPPRRAPVPAAAEAPQLPLVDVGVDPDRDAFGREDSDGALRVPSVTVRLQPVPPLAVPQTEVLTPGAALDRVEALRAQAAASGQPGAAVAGAPQVPAG